MAVKRQIGIYTYLYIIGIAGIMSSCSTHKTLPKYDDVVHERHEALMSHLSPKREALLEEAQSWIGTPYKYAAQEKGEGTDCSGLIMQLYLQCLDYHIPRNSAKQAEFCVDLRRDDALPGDLVFFATGKDATRVTHVGMLMDEAQFIHASSSKGVVISRLDNPWYAARLLKFGRIPYFIE